MIGENLHYFNHRPVKMRGNKNLLPFTLVLQGEFPEGVVKETTFQFGIDSIKGFLQKHFETKSRYYLPSR